MKVKLINYTTDPERMVAMSARLCYSPVGAEDLVEKMSIAQVEKLVSKIVEMGHLSTLEHVSFTFAIEGVSRVLTHQLVRHRIASYSQQSQRYVGEHDFECIMPPTIEANQVAREKFEQLMATIRNTYTELVELGIHKEDARYCLANAAETKIVVTMNARTLLHFFELRCCARAQWEIRRLAELMLSEVKTVAPLLFKKAGPTCVTNNYCGEGELTCGRLAAMQGSGKNS
jgi:thymidylate synthase (FAD)